MFSFLFSLWGVKVARDTQTLLKYSRDISIFKMTPKEVYFPRTVHEVQQTVRKIAELHKTDPHASVTVRAGGTCMSGGPLNTGSIIDMTKYMNRVHINPQAKTATVEMGAYFRDIEDEAAKYNLMFAPYPSSKRICGIGGMIGNNASGEKSVRFGATSDNIISMEVLLADGTLITAGSKSIDMVTDRRERTIMMLASRYGKTLASAMGDVKKAASGYRLDKVIADDVFNLVPLFSGAQGTLGIVTKAVLQLVPIPKHLSLIVISANKLEDIPILVQEIFKYNPEAVETFDVHTFAKAREHLQIHADRMLPYVDPKAQLYILAEFSEPTKEATNKVAAGCVASLKKKKFKVAHVENDIDSASIWEVRRNSFLLMRDHNGEGYKAVPCIEDVIVPVPALSQFISELHAILKRRNIIYGFHGHIGDGSLRIVPVFAVTHPHLFEEITGLMKEVFALVKKLKGNMSADHSDGIIRSPFLKEFYGPELYAVFSDIKRLYDPYSILNPGKKVGTSVETISRYFDVSS